MPDRSRGLLLAIVGLGVLARFLWLGTPLTFSDAPHHALATTTLVYSLGPSFLYDRYWRATLDEVCGTRCAERFDPHSREHFIARARLRGRPIGLRERIFGLDHGFTIHVLSYPFYVAANWLGLPLTEAILNLPSALVGSLAVLLVYALARELGRGPFPAAVAALVASFAPLHVGYSRSTAGTFVFATFFSALTVLCYSRAFATRKLRWHAAAVVSLVLWTGGDNLFPLAPLVLVVTAFAIAEPTSRRRALVSLLPAVSAALLVAAFFYLRDLDAVRQEGPRATGYLIRLWTKGAAVDWQPAWIGRGAVKLFGGPALLLVGPLAALGVLRGERQLLPTAWLLIYLLPFFRYLVYADAMLHILVPVAILTGDGVGVLCRFVHDRARRSVATATVALLVLCLAGALLVSVAPLFQTSRPFPDAAWKWYYGRRVPDAGSKAAGFLLRTRYEDRRTCAYAEGMEFYWGRDVGTVQGTPGDPVLTSCEVLVAWTRSATPYLDPERRSIQDVVLRRALVLGFRAAEIVRGSAGTPLVYILTRDASSLFEHDADDLNRRFDRQFGWLPALAVPDRSWPLG